MRAKRGYMPEALAFCMDGAVRDLACKLLPRKEVGYSRCAS